MLKAYKLCLIATFIAAKLIQQGQQRTELSVSVREVSVCLCKNSYGALRLYRYSTYLMYIYCLPYLRCGVSTCIRIFILMPVTFTCLELSQFLTKEKLLTQYPLCCVAQMSPQEMLDGFLFCGLSGVGLCGKIYLQPYNM